MKNPKTTDGCCGECCDHGHGSHTHPMVVFWLGVLTGAVVIGLIFFYGALRATDYQSAVLKLQKVFTAPAVETTQTTKGIGGQSGF